VEEIIYLPRISGKQELSVQAISGSNVKLGNIRTFYITL
jgi:hypothetical protein